MKSYSVEAFQKFIQKEHIIGFFGHPIKLVSGRTSSWYVNWRNALYDAYLLDVVSNFVLSFLSQRNITAECFYGIPDGTTKLATVCQYKFVKSKRSLKKGQYVFSMGRKTPKDHGDPKDRFFVGQPRGKVVVIEDVTTTGESLLKHVKILHDFGVTVVAALTLTNRNEIRDDGTSIEQALQKIGVPFFSLSNALDLLPPIIAKEKPDSILLQSIIDEFDRYGVHKLDS